MTDTIIVSGDYTVADGQIVSLSDPLLNGLPLGYLLRPQSLVTPTPTTFSLAGTVSVTEDLNNSVGIEDDYQTSDPTVAANLSAARLIIASTGRLSDSNTAPLQSTTGIAQALGFVSAAGYMSLENHGLVTATSAHGPAFGVMMSDAAAARSIVLATNPVVINYGTIQATGSYGAAVELNIPISLTNTGSIIGDGGAAGVVVGAYGPTFAGAVTITNGGRILADNGSGIGIGVASAFDGEVDIINNSMIYGSVTAGGSFGGSQGQRGPVLHLHNNFGLQGSVVVFKGTAAGAQIFNSGSISGDVQLLDSSDHIYDGRGGMLGGTLTFGDGANQAWLGNDGETVYTGAGANIVHGGSGADTVHGGAGADTIAGGGGSDVIDGGGGLNTALYDGALNQYGFGPGYTQVIGGPEGGTDTLANIQRIQFVDGYLAFSPTDTAGQVYRLYEGTLNRAPDPAGLAAWARSLNAGMTLLTAANGFVSSAEFQGTYGALTDNAFVSLLYSNVLHRSADAGGLAYWTGLLSSGHSRAEVVIGFTESAEDIADLAAPVQQGLWVQDGAAAEVARLYDTAFSRLPDVTGLAYWTSALEHGTTLLQAAQGFIASAEFQADYGSPDNAGFVTLLYNNVLHRAPDAGGQAYWVSLLNSGQDTRAQVVVGFSESAEHVADMAPHIDHGIWVA
jgi:hypothetical protein